MPVRHEALTGARGVILRRTHGDGRSPAQSIWCGREHGWAAADWTRPGLLGKAYSSKSNAVAALRRILRHENELGIHRRIGRRY